ITADVMESSLYDITIGMDWIKKARTNFDFINMNLTIRTKDDAVDVQLIDKQSDQELFKPIENDELELEEKPNLEQRIHLLAAKEDTMNGQQNILNACDYQWVIHAPEANKPWEAMPKQPWGIKI